jgi:hypothetical protein
MSTRRLCCIHQRPSVVVLAGPNGAGKSTMCSLALCRTQRLPPSRPAALCSAASMNWPRGGGVSVSKQRWQVGLSARESTGSSRRATNATWCFSGCQARTSRWRGWQIGCVSEVIRCQRRRFRRRYRSGLRNFFRLYQTLTTTWRMYDNSTDAPRLIASGAGTETLTVNDADLWRRIRAEAGHES